MPVENVGDVSDLDMSDSSDQDADDIAVLDIRSPEPLSDKVDIFDSLAGSFLQVTESEGSASATGSDDEEEEDKGKWHASCTNMRSIRRRLGKVATRDRLFALPCLNGRCAFNEKRFNILRKAFMAKDKTLKIPEPRTVKNMLRRTLLLESFPKKSGNLRQGESG